MGGINSAKPPTVQQRGIDTMMLGVHADIQTAMYGCIFGDEETKAKNLLGLSDKVKPLLEGINRQFGDVQFLYVTFSRIGGFGCGYRMLSKGESLCRCYPTEHCATRARSVSDKLKCDGCGEDVSIHFLLFVMELKIR